MLYDQLWSQFIGRGKVELLPGNCCFLANYTIVKRSGSKQYRDRAVVLSNLLVSGSTARRHHTNGGSGPPPKAKCRDHRRLGNTGWVEKHRPRQCNRSASRRTATAVSRRLASRVFLPAAVARAILHLSPELGTTIAILRAEPPLQGSNLPL